MAEEDQNRVKPVQTTLKIGRPRKCSLNAPALSVFAEEAAAAGAPSGGCSSRRGQRNASWSPAGAEMSGVP